MKSILLVLAMLGCAKSDYLTPRSVKPVLPTALQVMNCELGEFIFNVNKVGDLTATKMSAPFDTMAEFAEIDAGFYILRFAQDDSFLQFSIDQSQLGEEFDVAEDKTIVLYKQNSSTDVVRKEAKCISTLEN